jgi:hypothetical protein
LNAVITLSLIAAVGTFFFRQRAGAALFSNLLRLAAPLLFLLSETPSPNVPHPAFFLITSRAHAHARA